MDELTDYDTGVWTLKKTFITAANKKVDIVGDNMVRGNYMAFWCKEQEYGRMCC